MILVDNYNKNEKAYYFASQATASLVYLEGGFILRIGLNSKTVKKPYNHDFCECGGIPGQSEIAIQLIGGLAVAKQTKKKFKFSDHEDFLKAKELAKKLDEFMGIISPGADWLIESAQVTAVQILNEIWVAIEKLAQAIIEFGKIDQGEATSIVKKALKDCQIEKCALSWNID